MRSDRYGRTAWANGMLLSVLAHVVAFLIWPDAVVLLDKFRGSERDATRHPDAVQLVRLAPPVLRTVPEATAVPVVTEVAVRRLAEFRPALDLARVTPVPAPPGAVLPLPGAASSLAERELYARPVAQTILPNWRVPRSLSGVVVTARVHVDAAGDATGLVELVPPTRNRDVNRQIVHRVRRLEYQPAHRNGEAVPAWAEITFVFCRTSVTATSPAPENIETPCAHDY